MKGVFSTIHIIILLLNELGAIRQYYSNNINYNK